MIFKGTRLLLGAAVLAVAAAGILGTTTLSNIWKSARADFLQSSAQGLVRDDVAVRSAIEEVRKRLPAHLAATRAALAECTEQTARQTRLLAEDQEAVKLVEKDLRELAGPAQADQPATLRGRAMTAQEVRDEAARLLGAKRRQEQGIRSRRAILDALLKQRQKLEAALAQAEAAAAQFGEQARSAATKVELLQMAKRAEVLSCTTGVGTPLGEAPESLRALNKRLDLRLQEMEERQRLDDRTVTEDRYQTEARTATAMDELRKLYPTTNGSGERTRKDVER